MDYSLLLYVLKKPDFEEGSHATDQSKKQTLVMRKNENGENIFELKQVSEALPSSSSQAVQSHNAD